MTDDIEMSLQPAVMKAAAIEKPGGPEVLKLVDRPVPEPAADEVLIKVTGAGINRPDVLQRMGFYPPPPGASDLPGLEVAGEIVAVGKNAGDWRVGEQVCALIPGGGYAQYACAHFGACLPVPEGLTLFEAAGLPETMFTVWANVFDDAALKSGETLLVHGGTSGIGTTAIGLAKAFGARAIATAGTYEKCTATRQLGADAVFNYTEDNWENEIIALGGADVVLDMTGGDFVNRNLECLNPGGRHVSIAFLRGATAEINILNIMRKRLKLSGSTLRGRDAAEKTHLANAIRTHVWPLIVAGKVGVAIDQIYPLADVAKAHIRMESGAHIGKIILDAS